MSRLVKIGTLTVALAVTAARLFGTAASAEEVYYEGYWKLYSSSLPVEQLERAYRKDSRNSEKRLELVDGLLRRSIDRSKDARIRLAIKDLKSALHLTEDLFSSNEIAAEMRAFAYLRLYELTNAFLDDKASAKQYANAALRLLDKHASTTVQMNITGELYSSLGHDEEGSKALQLQRRAIEYFDKSLAKQPKNIDALLGRATALRAIESRENLQKRKEGLSEELIFGNTIEACDATLKKFPKCEKAALLKARCQIQAACNRPVKFSLEKATKIQEIDAAYAPAFLTLQQFEIKLDDSDEPTRRDILLAKADFHRLKAIELDKRVSSDLGLIEIGESLRILNNLGVSSARNSFELNDRISAFESAGDIANTLYAADAAKYYRKALKACRQYRSRWPELRRESDEQLARLVRKLREAEYVS